ncbi:hypothetical protein DFJ74DRAFT_606145 [Hyaloraphidium curvatum]|nr:hypothetical protein DFJ74DRAFT_606145 [Hyaloraphidium curvatum]
MRDFRTLKGAEQLAEHILRRWEQKKFHIIEYFCDWAAVKPDAECLWYQHRVFSYRELNSISNRVYHFMSERMGLKPGAMAGMLLQNCPEFLMVQIGLAKLKVAQAWMNYNLRGASFLGCLDIAGPELLVFETAMADHVLETLDKLLDRPKPVKLVLFDNEGGADRVVSEITKRGGKVEVITEKILLGYSDAEPDPAIRREGTKKEDTMCLIYTSGTTGLPKATNIPFSRAGSAHLSWVCAGLFNEQDRFYQTLPLFHSSGQIGVTLAWMLGIPLVLGRKFSARNFFKEAAESKATVFQYIGELGRYLVGTPPSQYDRAHQIRGGLGNGMRADIWMEFKNRFGIPHLFEFYGATDGNILTFQNHGPDSPPGALGSCGFIGPLFDSMAGSARLVKWDADTELPVRDADGFCIPADWGEPGEMIGRIDPPEKSKLGVDNWSGYYGNVAATNKKVLTDCFEKGDRWLRQGDLLRREYPGWLFFVDRIGDTFRWKGENVSTTEVGTFVMTHPAISECNVYGIKLPPPQSDGRIGAAVVRLDASVADLGGPKEKAAMKELGKWVSERLPHYAVPRFLRVQDGELEVTGTHKHRKVDLQNDGCDPNKIKDRQYWMPPGEQAYLPYGQAEWKILNAGKAKL